MSTQDIRIPTVQDRIGHRSDLLAALGVLYPGLDMTGYPFDALVYALRHARGVARLAVIVGAVVIVGMAGMLAVVSRVAWDVDVMPLYALIAFFTLMTAYLVYLTSRYVRAARAYTSVLNGVLSA